LPTFPGGERERESFSSRGKLCVTSPAAGLNFCSSNMQSTSKSTFEWFSAKYATPDVSGCPRVFCMGKSEWEKFIFSLWFMLYLVYLLRTHISIVDLKGGHLLLSNTRHLGIVCSCHCCHMSILKFCEVNNDKTGSTLLRSSSEIFNHLRH